MARFRVHFLLQGRTTSLLPKRCRLGDIVRCTSRIFRASQLRSSRNRAAAKNISVVVLSSFCGCLLLKCGWTEVGRKIQSLSSICPDSVQSLSNNRSCTESVQSLSKSGPNSVKPMTDFKQRGQTLDIRIQSLSNVCPNQLRK